MTGASDGLPGVRDGADLPGAGDGAGLPGAGNRADRLDALAREFEAHRSHLLRIAYATTGSLADAEDCVQDAWLRLRGVAEPGQIRDLRAWLTTVVGRLALDSLGSARARRERYVGTWLPEPLVEEDHRYTRDPADRVTLDESVSMALLVVLERLSPAQRTAFLLHDVFGLPFDEVAGVVGRSPAAVRQLAARARQQVEQARPRVPATRTQQRALVDAFVSACERGDLDELLRLLDPQVVLRGDGGGKVTALVHTEYGAARVARLMLGFGRRPARGARVALVNGVPGLVLRDGTGVLSVVAFTVDGDRIAAIDVIRNPDKLAGVPEPGPWPDRAGQHDQS